MNPTKITTKYLNKITKTLGCTPITPYQFILTTRQEIGLPYNTITWGYLAHLIQNDLQNYLLATIITVINEKYDTTPVHINLHEPINKIPLTTEQDATDHIKNRIEKLIQDLYHLRPSDSRYTIHINTTPPKAKWLHQTIQQTLTTTINKITYKEPKCKH